MKKALFGTGAFFVGAATVGGFILDLIEGCGIPLPTALDAMMAYAFVWLPLASFILGVLIGWQLKARRITQEDITTERTAELEAEKDTAVANESQISNILTGDDAIAFIRNLPRNLRAVLLGVYEAGGSVERDLFDPDMQILAGHGLVSRPPLAPMGPTKWSLTPGTNALIRDRPEVLGDDLRDSGQHDLDKLEDRFLTMSFLAQSFAWAAYTNGETKSDDGESPEPHRSEAQERGFVRLEPCGAGMWRTVPTGKLRLLMARRPEVEMKVSEGIIREGYGIDVDWRTGTKVGDGIMFAPKGADEREG